MNEDIVMAFLGKYMLVWLIVSFCCAGYAVSSRFVRSAAQQTERRRMRGTARQEFRRWMSRLDMKLRNPRQNVYRRIAILFALIFQAMFWLGFAHVFG